MVTIEKANESGGWGCGGGCGGYGDMEVMVGVVVVDEKIKKKIYLSPLTLSHVKYTMLKYITSLKYNGLHSYL